MRSQELPAFGLQQHLARIDVSPPTVSVNNLDFFRGLDALLADTPVDTMRAYLRYRCDGAVDPDGQPG